MPELRDSPGLPDANQSPTGELMAKPYLDPETGYIIDGDEAWRPEEWESEQARRRQAWTPRKRARRAALRVERRTRQPPTVAEVGDPFAALRVAHLLARIPRGEPVRLRDLVDRLNADYVDWSFSRPVVAAAIVQLQANWLTDHRTVEGIVIADGSAGATVRLEDSGRIGPWLVRQCERLAAGCRERLRSFAVEEGAIP